MLASDARTGQVQSEAAAKHIGILMAWKIAKIAVASLWLVMMAIAFYNAGGGWGGAFELILMLLVVGASLGLLYLSLLAMACVARFILALMLVVITAADEVVRRRE